MIKLNCLTYSCVIFGNFEIVLCRLRRVRGFKYESVKGSEFVELKLKVEEGWQKCQCFILSHNIYIYI